MNEKGPNWHLRDRWWHSLILNNYIYGAMWIIGIVCVVGGVLLFVKILEEFAKLL